MVFFITFYVGASIAPSAASRPRLNLHCPRLSAGSGIPHYLQTLFVPLIIYDMNSLLKGTVCNFNNKLEFLNTFVGFMCNINTVLPLFSSFLNPFIYYTYKLLVPMNYCVIHYLGLHWTWAFVRRTTHKLCLSWYVNFYFSIFFFWYQVTSDKRSERSNDQLMAEIGMVGGKPSLNELFLNLCI